MEAKVITFISGRDRSSIDTISEGLATMNKIMREMHKEQTETIDPLDTICHQLYLGITPDRWAVLGKVERIIARLHEKGIFQPWMRDTLELLADCAEESL